MIKFKHLVSAGLVVGLSSVIAGNAMASGFQIWEQSATGTGDYHAGGAAEADDASTNFYNAAGLVRIKHPQFSAGVVGVSTDITFKGRQQVQEIAGSDVEIISDVTGRAQGGDFNAIPNFHFASPITKKIYFGFSIATPFGLETDWGDNSVVRYAATESKIMTIDLSPSLAFAFTKKLSFALGPDYQYIQGTFNQIIGPGVVSQGDGNARSFNTASAWGWGWHTGLLYQFTNNSRIGLSYRSKISHKLEGTSKAEDSSYNKLYPTNHHLSATTTLPPTTTLSYYQGIGPRWAIMASTEYTQWDYIRSLTMNNVVNPQDGTSTYETIPLHFKNTWNFSVGAHYKFNKQWMLKFGGGYDQTPSKDEYRDIRLPDQNRIALALGGEYQPTKSLAINAGWTHVFIKKAKINNTLIINRYGPLDLQAVTSGNVESSADVFGLQCTWTLL